MIEIDAFRVDCPCVASKCRAIIGELYVDFDKGSQGLTCYDLD